MKNASLLIAILTSIVGIAQQDIQITQFSEFQSWYNPAYTNIGQNKICGGLLGRNQWSGFGGRPNTGLISAQYNIDNLNYVGIQLVNDQIGNFNNTIAKLNYARSFSTPLMQVTAGIGINFHQSKIGTGYITPDTPVIDDDAINDNPVNLNTLDMDFGIRLKSRNVEVGLASSHLNQGKLNSGTFQHQLQRHYFVYSTYRYGTRIGALKPAIFGKTDGASLQIDTQVQMEFNNNIIAGLNYRLGDNVSPMLGYRFSNNGISAAIMYNYGISTNGLAPYQSGTHEIGIRVCFLPVLTPTLWKHPRI